MTYRMAEIKREYETMRTQYNRLVRAKKHQQAKRLYNEFLEWMDNYQWLNSQANKLSQ